MLSNATIKDIAKYLKVKESDLQAAISDKEEVAIAIPELKTYTTDEFAELETNLKEAGKSTHIKVGKELAIKDLKEKAGLEYDGKDPETFLTQYKDHVVKEAKIPANEAKQQWETEKKGLQEKIAEWEGKYKTESATRVEKEREALFLRKFPADRSKGLSDEDRLTLLKSKFEVRDEDGKEAFYYKGQRLQDEKMNDMALDAALDHVFTKENWKGEGGNSSSGNPIGNGHGDSERLPNFYNTMKEVSAAMTAKDISPLTKEGRDFVKAAQTANPKLDVNVV